MSSGPATDRPSPVPIPDRFRSIAGASPLALEVADIVTLAPGMRRLRLTGDDLRDFAHEPGQDLMIMVASVGERVISRRYTIRQFDKAKLLLDVDMVVHHGEGPGLRWANAMQPGDRLNAVGPRGKIFLNPDADWHLFTGDESAIAATLAMLEAAPDSAPTLAFLEIASVDYEVQFDHPKRRVTWLRRDAGASLRDALASAELPSGRGHVYANGEVALVNSIKSAMLARGLDADQVSVKAYWGRGAGNALNGEPEKRPS
jgi:NADPH-dependent ferric siderophore reductase